MPEGHPSPSFRLLTPFLSPRWTSFVTVTSYAIAVRQPVAHRGQGLWEQRGDYAGLLDDGAEDRRLVELVNPLVITETGALKAIAYDFDARFDVELVAGLSPEGLAEYKRRRLGELQGLIDAELARFEGRHELVDWFDQCTRTSESAGIP